MYGRDHLTPWEMENDLGPQKAPDLTIEETTKKIENICDQVLVVVAVNIKA